MFRSTFGPWRSRWLRDHRDDIAVQGHEIIMGEFIARSPEAGMLILMGLILVGPILAERFRIPGMVGLLVGGVLVGPHVLDWVARDSAIDRMGNIGILYLMFLAGLEFSLRNFKANQRTALVFGALGFIVPFGLSLWASISWLGLGLMGAMLVGAMWASNTLVAYPEAQEAGIIETRAVGSAVAGGVIADLLSLTVLAVVSSLAVDEIARESAEGVGSLIDIPVWIVLPTLAFASLAVIPRVARWFFVRVGHTRTQRFVFSIAAMAVASLLAVLGGVAGLIGAFLAGLGMNRLVPTNGPLFARIEFVGASIFVPAFLVSIGFTIDPRLLFDMDTLLLAALFTALVVGGKAVAAILVGVSAKFPFSETGILATLSMGQAASTLAIARIGVEYDVLEQSIANAAVLTIVITAFITSYGTRFFAKNVEPTREGGPPLGQKVLVDVRDTGGPVEDFMTLAAAFTAADGGMLVPFGVAPESQRVKGNLDRALIAAARTGQDAEGTLRLDDSFYEGVLQLAAEHEASLLMLGWEGPQRSPDPLQGSDLDRIGEHSQLPTLAVHVVGPWRRVIVVLGPLDSRWKRDDAKLAMTLARRATTRTKTPLCVHAVDARDASKLLGGEEGVEIIEVGKGVGEVRAGELLVIPAHAFHETTDLSVWRYEHPLAGASLVVVGGPHRLHVTSAAVARHAHGTVSGPGHLHRQVAAAL